MTLRKRQISPEAVGNPGCHPDMHRGLIGDRWRRNGLQGLNYFNTVIGRRYLLNVKRVNSLSLPLSPDVTWRFVT